MALLCRLMVVIQQGIGNSVISQVVFRITHSKTFCTPIAGAGNHFLSGYRFFLFNLSQPLQSTRIERKNQRQLFKCLINHPLSIARQNGNNQAEHTYADSQRQRETDHKDR